MSLIAAGAIALAAALDWLVREPPARIHPVALFGRLVAPLDRDWTLPRSVSFWIALLCPIAAGLAVGGVVALGSFVHPIAGGVLAGLALFSTTSLRLLLDEAAGVVAASATDIEAARDRLPALAGRDAADLSAEQLRSAAVESAAENLADGLVAPLLAFALLAPESLALAAGAAAWVKAVNTLDSMLGYPSKPHGWLSARLDDAVMWLPARLSALALTAVARSPDPMLSARRWSSAPPSPNSGWPMGTVASALQIKLEKPGSYTLNGVASLPTVEDAERAISLVGSAGLLAYAAAVLWEVLVWA
ncbi:adenosylcobinamide-phosphate synthase [Natronoarchaeum philippinense]|uniref:Probable cobalamin biosynthesis protein CobD n=1 Tax=Natronoarchaeum philippinense TaxID=558529 RepID=A0A285NY83_NATPI|nr:adenosylcobinamide-phosphate synthase CbiB [Natronoarchaeum philippinense]SNZ12601.1 adenosylcobinamide-phosphate synthase [Natronoarchaeum philippinense]